MALKSSYALTFDRESQIMIKQLSDLSRVPRIVCARQELVARHDGGTTHDRGWRKPGAEGQFTLKDLPSIGNAARDRRWFDRTTLVAFSWPYRIRPNRM